MTLNVHPKKGRKGQLYDFQVLVRPAEAKSSKESRAIPGQLDYEFRRSPWKPILVVLALLVAAYLILSQIWVFRLAGVILASAVLTTVLLGYRGESKTIPGQFEHQGRSFPWKPLLLVLALGAVACVILLPALRLPLVIAASAVLIIATLVRYRSGK